MKGSVVHHHLILYEEHNKESRTITDTVILTWNGEQKIFEADERHKTGDPHVFRACPIRLKKGEKAIILGLSMLYSHNDLETPIELYVRPLFEVPKAEDDVVDDDNVDVIPAHPDVTGKLKITIPGNHFYGAVPLEDRLLYQPNLVHLGINILQYAGTEDAIKNARSTGVSDQGIRYDTQVFMATDPLVEFLMTHRRHFPELHADDIRQITVPPDKGGGIAYHLKNYMVKRVREFFTHNIHPMFRYTTKQDVQLFWPMPANLNSCSERPVIMFMLKLDYVVVSPRIPTYKHYGIQISP